MKKSVLFLMAAAICIVVSCQDDKTFDKLVKANQGIQTLFTRYPDGSIQTTAGKPQNFPPEGIPYSTGNQWGPSIVNNSANWNTAFGWGNHAGLYEPKLGNPTVNGYVLSSTTTGVRSWVPNGSGGTMVYPSTAGIVVYNGTTWGTSIVNNSSNWNTAYGWGNHAGLYRPITWAPTWTDVTGKPTFATVATSGLFADLLSKPTTIAGYGITNAMSTSHPANVITSTNIANWNISYGWGNHSGLYRPVTWVPTWTDVTGKPTFAVVATSGLFADLLSKPTTVAGYGITNSMTTSHPANVITSINITNWNNAFGWGNHAGLYKLVSYVPTWAEITGKPSTYTPSTHTHAWTEITNKPPEQELIDAIASLGYLPIPGKTTDQINTIIPTNGGGIIFDVTLNVYKVFKNGQWVIVATTN